jgi:hypothetical protein
MYVLYSATSCGCEEGECRTICSDTTAPSALRKMTTPSYSGKNSLSAGMVHENWSFCLLSRERERENSGLGQLPRADTVSKVFSTAVVLYARLYYQTPLSMVA